MPAPTQAVASHQQLAVRAEEGPAILETPLVRAGQADQLAIVVQPAHDHCADLLRHRVPLQCGVEMTQHVAVSRCQRTRRSVRPRAAIAWLRISGSCFRPSGSAPRTFAAWAEPVQALEPLADQPGALEGRSLGDQRLAQRDLGLVLGMLGPGEACLGTALSNEARAALLETPCRDGRADGQGS